MTDATANLAADPPAKASGKKKLILSGFHEAALAAFGIQAYLYPAKRQFLQYTTTSPVMQKRLGLAEE